MDGYTALAQLAIWTKYGLPCIYTNGKLTEKISKAIKFKFVLKHENGNKIQNIRQEWKLLFFYEKNSEPTTHNARETNQTESYLNNQIETCYWEKRLKKTHLKVIT